MELRMDSRQTEESGRSRTKPHSEGSFRADPEGSGERIIRPRTFRGLRRGCFRPTRGRRARPVPPTGPGAKPLERQEFQPGQVRQVGKARGIRGVDGDPGRGPVQFLERLVGLDPRRKPRETTVSPRGHQGSRRRSYPGIRIAPSISRWNSSSFTDGWWFPKSSACPSAGSSGPRRDARRNADLLDQFARRPPGLEVPARLKSRRRPDSGASSSVRRKPPAASASKTRRLRSPLRLMFRVIAESA